RFLMFKLLKRARQRHVGLPSLTQTRYINTISPEQEPWFPGDEELERRIRRLIRWNAVAMVLRANNKYSGIGGHLATYASAASLSGISLAARDGLDNLTFVINCNLQRLDGPVRGNGKIIQELEGLFRGAGWNVIKVVWGREWDELLARDVDGVLVEKMNATLDGEFQKMSVATSGSYVR